MLSLLFYLQLYRFSMTSMVLASPITTVPNVWPFNSAKDPNHFGWITSWTAIGDSYAAGIGAGSSPEGSDDTLCSRYGEAYPVLLNELMEISQDQFQFLACTGVWAPKTLVNHRLDCSLKHLTLGYPDRDQGSGKIHPSGKSGSPDRFSRR